MEKDIFKNPIPIFDKRERNLKKLSRENKLAKWGDAIATSNLKLSMNDWLTGVTARRCYRI